MTVEPYTSGGGHTVSGVGPYLIPFRYDEDTILVTVSDGETTILLAEDERDITPESSETSGDVFLTAQAAIDYDGYALTISRATPAQQGWAGDTPKEIGLEAQLDRIVMGVQELQLALPDIATNALAR